MLIFLERWCLNKGFYLRRHLRRFVLKRICEIWTRRHKQLKRHECTRRRETWTPPHGAGSQARPGEGSPHLYDWVPLPRTCICFTVYHFGTLIQSKLFYSPNCSFIFLCIFYMYYTYTHSCPQRICFQIDPSLSAASTCLSQFLAPTPGWDQKDLDSAKRAGIDEEDKMEQGTAQVLVSHQIVEMTWDDKGLGCQPQPGSCFLKGRPEKYIAQSQQIWIGRHSFVFSFFFLQF